MKLSAVVSTFAAAVLAAVIGWFAGGVLRDATAPRYDTAVGVVNAEVGAPVETSSPTPSVAPPSASAAPSETPDETDEPEDTPGSVICEGAPPGENCDCDLEDGEWVWRCEIPATDGAVEPSASPLFPTP